MGILSGIVSFFLGISVNALDYITKILYAPFGYSLETFEKFFPAAAPFREMFVYLGVGIMLLIFVFQLLRSFGVPVGIQAEDPIKLLLKVGLFWGLILRSESLMDYILSIFTTPLNVFSDTELPFNSVGILDIVTNMIGGAATIGISVIVNIVLTLVLAWQFIKLLLEVIERYVVLCIVIYTAPLALAVGPFESTSQIFKSWTRLLSSQILLVLLNVWSIRLFNSFFLDGLFSYTGTDFILAFLVGLAYLKAMQKLDTLLRIVGLNTASTGAALGASISGAFATTMAASRMAGRYGKGFNAKEGKGNHENSGKSGAANGENVKMPGAGSSGGKAANGQGQKSSGLTAEQSGMVSAMRSSYQQVAQTHSAYSPDKGMVKSSSNIVNSKEALVRGQDANAVAGNMVQPAEGFEQSPMAMDNGDAGFLYMNKSTGEAYAVTYNTAGNGVVTGEMAPYDLKTGGIGEMKPFTMTSVETANELGINPGTGDTVVGRDGKSYIPVENLSAGEAPFQMTPMNVDEAGTEASASQSDHSGTFVNDAGITNTSIPAETNNVVQGDSTTQQSSEQINVNTQSSDSGASSVVHGGQVPGAGTHTQGFTTVKGGSSVSGTETNGGHAGQNASSPAARVGMEKSVSRGDATPQSESYSSVTQKSSDRVAGMSSQNASANTQPRDDKSQTAGKGTGNTSAYQPPSNKEMGGPNEKEETFVGKAARVEPVTPPVPHNLEGKAETVKRPNVTDPDTTPIDGINAPEGDKKSFGQKIGEKFDRVRDIFR